MKVGKLDFLLFAIIGCYCTDCTAFAVTLFSDYGQIQNVQNYSTNPFWTPNSPYNQKVPQPIYVQGTNTSNSECLQIVQSAVSTHCATRNNCKNTTLSDIRPAIIVQLAGLPGKAYGTACIGYLDTAYESYIAQHAGNAPTKQIAFPETIAPNSSLVQNTVSVSNVNTVKTPQWRQEINDRAQELKELQEENNAGNTHSINATQFPTTFNDLSFTERNRVLAKGYEPYKGKSAYKTLEVKNASEWCSIGENEKNAECVEYFCSKNGPKANEDSCIEWRCNTGQENDEYCKLYENCGGGKAGTDQCMQYRCTQKTSDKNTAICKQWLCNKGLLSADKCLAYTCTIENFYNATDSCKKYLCDKKTGIYKTHEKCVEYLCQTDKAYFSENQRQCAENYIPGVGDITLPDPSEKQKPDDPKPDELLCDDNATKPSCCKPDEHKCVKDNCDDKKSSFRQLHKEYCDALVCKSTVCCSTKYAGKCSLCKDAKFRKENKALCTPQKTQPVNINLK